MSSDFDDIAEKEDARSREIADITRKYLVTLNSGAVIIIFGLVGALVPRGIDPSWARWPVSCFSLGLVITGFSLNLAKHKAQKRREAALNTQPRPPYKKLFQRNFTYESLALFMFILGLFVSISSLGEIHS